MMYSYERMENKSYKNVLNSIYYIKENYIY